MRKETKIILTREGCQKDLIGWAKRCLVRDVLLLVVMAVIFVPLFLLSVAVAGEFPALGIPLAVICAAAPLWFVGKIACNIRIFALTARGGFSLVRDRVRYTAKGETPRKPFGGNSPVNVLYFEKYGRYVPSETVFSLTAPGDAFYVARLHTKNGKTVFAYHTAMYEYKEI